MGQRIIFSDRVVAEKSKPREARLALTDRRHEMRPRALASFIGGLSREEKSTGLHVSRQTGPL
jgi:hypothetical protein